jgi:hypothetical protein
MEKIGIDKIAVSGAQALPRGSSVRFPVLERLPVIVGQPHLPLQHLADQRS